MKYLVLLGVILGLAGAVHFRNGQTPAPGPHSDRIQTISRGERVDLDDHVTSDGWTVVEFGADW